MLRVAAFCLLLLACKTYDPLYCDEDTPCTDPDRPYCDLSGEFPASEGHGKTCIPDPFPDVDGGAQENFDAAGPRRVVKLVVGGRQTCALLNDGAVRCWGARAAHGYEVDEPIGDDEHPFEVGDLPMGGPVKDVALGLDFGCALYEAGNVRCWGENGSGRLGYGDNEPRLGPGYTPDKLDDVDLGGIALQISAGESHVCAVLEGGDIRCWGYNAYFQLGNDGDSVGDNEVPAEESPVATGGTAIAVSAGRSHTCAILEGDRVMCWGMAYPCGDGVGPLGYDDPPEAIGDDETPEQAGTIELGSPAKQVDLGENDMCALLAGGGVKCWGCGEGGLGYAETEDIGDDETPGSRGNVPIGFEVEEITVTFDARCARSAEGAVRCWGYQTNGELGTGESEHIGDTEDAGDAGDVMIGGTVKQLATNGTAYHVCVLMDDDSVRCWGSNSEGQLGLGNTFEIGDNEVPADIDPVRVLE